MSNKKVHFYNENFFKYINKGSKNASEIIIPIITNHFEVKSVLDVGCGSGIWLESWRDSGIADVSGIDGCEVDSIKASHISQLDLCNRFDLERSFSIVQCLEVAEHIPEEYSSSLISSICKHSEVIIFSAAPPGQGGEHHVNEQCFEYWRRHFNHYGYSPYDLIRDKIINIRSIPPWYRYNMLVYIKDNSFYSNKFSEDKINKKDSIIDLSPLTYKIRKKIISFLPVR
ncbi:methyltransferase domain-containing protein, partial [Vibrio breoganii]